MLKKGLYDAVIGLILTLHCVFVKRLLESKSKPISSHGNGIGLYRHIVQSHNFNSVDLFQE